jgi:NADH-quinone oxidoreductase subunit G
LSLLTPGIADLAQKPYLLMNQREAKQLGVETGQTVSLIVEEQLREIPLRLAEWVPRGKAIVPSGLPGLRGLVLPALGRILLVEHGGEEAKAA